MRIRLALLAAFLTVPVLAQENVVVPQTAGQNQVRWDSFDWKFIDLLEGEGKGAGIRLYWYAGERAVAERAAARIVEEYEHLTKVFGFEPKERIPYILYDSHQELEQTNLFQIGEGTLGVTSPLDLRMTAAYWGDHQRFRHVSLHEMTHQFTIQKVNAVAKSSKVSGSPLEGMPLWFIEGLAEWVSTPGFGPDDEWWVRDLVANAAPGRGWYLRNFFDDQTQSFAFTYKVGQARLAFLADIYGADTPQKILDQSYRLRPGQGPGLFGTGGDSRSKKKAIGFERLLQEVTGDSPEKIHARWEDWLKKRYFSQYLIAAQQPSDLKREDAVRGNPDSFVISPDAKAIVYRTIDPATGIGNLVIVDPRDGSSAEVITRDNKPGADSLHYFDRAVAAIDEKRIAWIARSGPRDVVHVGRWKHSSRDRERGGELQVDARIAIGDFRAYNGKKHGVRELGSPSFSPDGTKLALTGLDEDGVVDVWILELDSGKWTRATDDLYSEREVDWGTPGIAFSSDRTPKGNFDLFLLDTATSEVSRIRPTASNHRHPKFQPGTSKLLYSGDESGRWDIYEIDVSAPAPVPEVSEVERVTTAGTEPIQRTDFSAGLTHPAIAGERLWGLGFVGGQFRLYSLPVGKMLTSAGPSGVPETAFGEPQAIPSRSLDGSVDYKVWNTGNWALENAFVALGAGNGIFGGGFLYYQDLLRDRTVVVQGQAFGDVSLTDLQVIYFDRARRVPLGVGAFMAPTFVRDPEFSTDFRPIYFLERKFGVMGLAEYPFNRYVRAGTGLGVATTSREVPKWLDNFATDEAREDWTQRNDGWAAEINGSVHTGYDTLVWGWPTGPLTGTSVLATVNGNYMPARETWYGDASLDAQRYFRVASNVALGFRATTGRAFGDEWRRPFFVYSTDNMRGVPWYSYDYLIADSYLVGQTELVFPLDRIIRVAIFDGMTGVAGVDGGSLYDQWSQAEGNATAAGVLGVNMRLAIFDMRLHFARPFDVGGIEPGETRGRDGEVIVPDGWVTNFSIRYAWF